MQRILSVLLSFVLIQAQLLAKSGGPTIRGGIGSVKIVGTYSGSLIPENASESATHTADGSDELNSLGLFTVGLPESGPGLGSFVIFTQGNIFAGTITAVGAPNTAVIRGLLEAKYHTSDYVRLANGNIAYDLSTGQPLSQTASQVVRGSLEATVTPAATTETAIATANFGRIEGTAELGVIGTDGTASNVLRYIVDGAKQSDLANGASNGLSNAGGANGR